MSNHNFCTPPDILEKIRLLDPKRGIGLDPCSNDMSMVEAKTGFMGPDNGGIDGLAESWRRRGLVFMNPPHSMSPNNIEPWMQKAYDEFPRFSSPGPKYPDTRPANDQFVGLIPAKTDTAWFHLHVTPFPVKVFLRGRPKFWLNGAPMPGPGKFASMLIYAGKNPQLFRDIFGQMGWVV